MTEPCQICGSRERSHVISHEGMDLFRCNDCGLVFLDPMLKAPQVAAIYTGRLTSAIRGDSAKVKKKIRRGRRRVKQIKRFVSGGAFLDVGCGGGFVTQAAHECGCAAYGFDLDPVKVAYARERYPSNTFFASSLEEFDPGPRRFDAVYCSEVIEHAPDTNGFVASLSALMAPGAVLYLTTPDISHWRRPRDLRRGMRLNRRCIASTSAPGTSRCCSHATGFRCSSDGSDSSRALNSSRARRRETPSVRPIRSPLRGRALPAASQVHVRRPVLVILLGRVGPPLQHLRLRHGPAAWWP